MSPRLIRSLIALAIATSPCLVCAHGNDNKPVSDPSLTVPASAISASKAFWKKRGITSPQGSFVLKHPWSPPWSGRSLVVPVTWIKQGHETLTRHLKSGKPEMIKASALRKDLPILHMVLKKNYSGWEIAAKKGWDWNAWFTRWDTMLAARGSQKIPASKAFAPWYAYERFQIDAHSGPHIPAMVDQIAHSESAMLKHAPDGPCTRLQTTDGKWHDLDTKDPAQQPHSVRKWNGKALVPASDVVYPSTWGTAQDIACSGQTIATKPFWSPYPEKRTSRAVKLTRSIAALSGGQKGLALYHTVAPGIGYLRLASFVDAGNQALAKLLPKLPASAGHEKVLIVDLRGNGGGSAPLGSLSRWVPVDKITRKMSKTRKRSCLFPGLWFNLGQMLGFRMKPPGSDGFRQTMKVYAKGLSAPPVTTCPVSFKTTRGQWAYTDHHFARHWHGSRPRLLLLVDNMCGSDCEGMIWYLAQLPGTVIAGQNTYGLIGFTQPGEFMLPHTHVFFGVATSYIDAYGDGRSANAYGLDVDVVLPAQADWRKSSILALARALEPSS